MSPLDDHELLLWAMRAGLARAEVRAAERPALFQVYITGRGAGACIPSRWLWALTTRRAQCRTWYT